MSLPVFVTPRLVRVYYNSQPLDIWMVGIPYPMANSFTAYGYQPAGFLPQITYPTFHSISSEQTVCGFPSVEPVHTTCEPVLKFDEEICNPNYSFCGDCPCGCTKPNAICSMQEQQEHMMFSANPITTNYTAAAESIYYQPDFVIDENYEKSFIEENYQKNIVIEQNYQQDFVYEENQENYWPEVSERNYLLETSANGSQLLNVPDHYLHPSSNFDVRQNCDSSRLPCNNFENNEAAASRLFFDPPKTFHIYSVEKEPFFINNEKSGIYGFISNNSAEWGLSHPLGHIMKSKRAMFCSFVLRSGNICYVKFTHYGIKFSSNRSGISYLIDEAGVRTCWETFKTVEEILEMQHTWKLKALQLQMQKKSYNYEKWPYSQRQITDEMLWNASPDQKIRIEREGFKFFSETTSLQSLSMNLNDFYVSSTLEEIGKPIGRIYIQCFHASFKKSVVFNGTSLQIKYHTQSARLDNYGQLSLRD